MPRKERCKRIRKQLLNAAASNVPKLSSFGFKKLSDETDELAEAPSSYDPIASSSTNAKSSRSYFLTSDFPNTAVSDSSDSALEVTPDLMIHEDFIGMYLIEKPDAETIAASFKDVLLRCNLKLSDCRWQAYDGAATMSGHLSGVGARLQAENLAAHRIHCANHRLDLALKGCANESKVISDSLSFVQDLSVVIRHSPLRMSTYENVAKDLEPDKSVESLHLLCPTRWTVRTKSISAVLSNYQAICATLLGISENGSTRENRDKAAGFAEKTAKFTTFFWIEFCNEHFQCL